MGKKLHALGAIFEHASHENLEQQTWQFHKRTGGIGLVILYLARHSSQASQPLRVVDT
jgi:hypothetical protein